MHAHVVLCAIGYTDVHVQCHVFSLTLMAPSLGTLVSSADPTLEEGQRSDGLWLIMMIPRFLH